MLDELPGITVLTEQRLKSVQHEGRRIQAMALAGAGVPYRVGCEGRDEFGESLAPTRADKQLPCWPAESHADLQLSIRPAQSRR